MPAPAPVPEPAEPAAPPSPPTPEEPIPATGDDEAIVEDPSLFVDSIADDVAEPAPPEPAPNAHAPDEPEKQDDYGEDDFGEDW